MEIASSYRLKHCSGVCRRFLKFINYSFLNKNHFFIIPVLFPPFQANPRAGHGCLELASLYDAGRSFQYTYKKSIVDDNEDVFSKPLS